VNLPALGVLVGGMDELREAATILHGGSKGGWNENFFSKILSGRTEFSGLDLENVRSMAPKLDSIVTEFAGRLPRSMAADLLVPVSQEGSTKVVSCYYTDELIFAVEDIAGVACGGEVPGREHSGVRDFSWPKTMEEAKEWEERGVYWVSRKYAGDEGRNCAECDCVGSPDSMVYRERAEANYCEECAPSSGEQMRAAGEWLGERAGEIGVGKTLPVDPRLVQSVRMFLEQFSKGKDKSLNDGGDVALWERAAKARLNPEQFAFLGTIMRNKSGTQGLVGEVDETLGVGAAMAKSYPNVKGFRDFPAEFKVVESYFDDPPGFTLTITPSEEFFSFARRLYPNVDKVWRSMSDTPHHPRSLAYARCSWDMGGSLVINNLQRDADSDNYEARGSMEGLEAAQFIDRATKSWDVMLLHAVRDFCSQKGIRGYLTTFEQQADKWGRLPKHKSKRTYDDTPAAMGMPQEDPDRQAQDLLERNTPEDVPMSRVASWVRSNCKGLGLVPLELAFGGGR